MTSQYEVDIKKIEILKAILAYVESIDKNIKELLK